ncbi:hypothetical protein TUM4644_00060 [Shewanella colwelliana]|uniref:DUF3016 domain-containing protein n=1 Tax=Shewanella colwelliana TaxID=23 RepID=A0A1E5IT92_SHECO|nr:DUF3016 domain-containing protein [Shewanella colwelliana]MDX1279981.1 DUF3016 domain-containing protein [Shewanella colwelliana]OEG73248.1 hypothetical protein BEL05_13325 [Shewanella colwelliana]GIU16230.1 hypothetical protein TUM4644_00060 [Shewanella colwelliana]GIU38729.1 hypothetical protein TUM3794_11720 [Shewanella colwelliana]
MKFKSLLVVGALVSLNVVAADEPKVDPVTETGIVKITWQDVDSYRDVKAVSDIQSRYEKRTFETLTKNLNKEAAKHFKPNQTLEMVVTDVDLAGDVRPTFGATTNDLRVIKDLYPPRMTFSYKVLDGDQVIVAGDEKLTDMSFMHTTGIRSDKPLSYESKMLADWLKKSITPQL